MTQKNNIASSNLRVYSFIEEAIAGVTPAIIGGSKTEADYTSIAFNNSESKLTVGGGDLIADGFKKGVYFTLSDLTEAANNVRIYVDEVLSATELTVKYMDVDPDSQNTAPVDMAADTSFTMTFPNMVEMPRTTGSLNLTKDTYDSEIIRSDRMVSDSRHGPRQVGGDLETELALYAYDGLIQAVMGGTWVAGVAKTEADLISITGDAAASKFTFGSSVVDQGFAIGQVVAISGTTVTDNNARFLITNISGASNEEITVVCVDSYNRGVTSMVTENSFSIVSTGKYAGIGNGYRSFTFQVAQPDVNIYHFFEGIRINSLAMSVPNSGMIKATFNLIGLDGKMGQSAPLQPSNEQLKAQVGSSMDAVSGLLGEGGNLIARVTDFNFTIDNQIGGKNVVGSNIKAGLVLNTQTVTGSLEAIVDDTNTFMTKFDNEIDSSVFLLTSEGEPSPSSNFHVYYFPRVKFNSASEGDNDTEGLPTSVDFVALAPPSTDVTKRQTQSLVQVSNA